MTDEGDTTEERAMAEEMREHLAAIHRDARGDLDRELHLLFLLTVEREKLAVVGYGGEGLHARIGRLAVGDDVRAVVARALRWASLEEAAHVVLARGLLARSSGFLTRMKTIAANFGGLVAGWSSAVIQHTRFWQAPFSQVFARSLTFFGWLGGKVPRSARSALKAQSFVGFCRFQAAAELTAVLAWERMGELLRSKTEQASMVGIAEKIAKDERHHKAVLGVILDSFDDDDKPRDGTSASQLQADIAAVDPSFAGRAHRHAVGSGGTVLVRESDGARRADKEAMRALLRETLVDTGLLADVFAKAPPSPRVAVKTMFMMSYDERDPSTHVDLVLAEELARLLREHGASEVRYLEAPNHFDQFFGGRSVAEVATYIGFESELFTVVDVSEEQVAHAYERGIGQDTVAKSWRDADLRISLGKMRTHPSWLVHLTLGSLESLGRRVDEMIFRDRHTELMTGLMMLLDAFPPDLAVLDATHHVPDGLTGILGSPRPSHPGRLYAARDPLALDLVAARHMGITRFPKTNSLATALEWFDDPGERTKVDGPDTIIAPFSSPHRNDLTVFLSAMAYPAYVFGDDRGSLWLPIMDPKAFPMLARPGLLQRIARPLLRWLFGYGHPG